jgi:hypothetical protein
MAHPLARADVVRGVGHVAPVGLLDHARAPRVAHEDPVLGQVRAVDVGRPVHRGGAQVGAAVGAHADLAALVAAVPPDLVAVAAGPGEVVADGQVLDGDSAGLVDDDAVPADAAVGVLERGAGRAGLAGRPIAAVDDDLVPVQATDVQARRLDPDAGRGPLRALLVIDARPDQDPVTGAGRVDRALHGRVHRHPARARRRAAIADEQHALPAPGGARERSGQIIACAVRGRRGREGLAPGDPRHTGERQRERRAGQPPPSHHGSPVSPQPTCRLCAVRTLAR